VCTFSSHAGYSSFNMVTSVVDAHASDLANLVSAPSVTDTLTIPTVPAKTTVTVTGQN